MTRKCLAVACLTFWIPALAFSQGAKSLADQSYKDAVLQKVAGIVESKYVLADRAKEFADEFRKRCTSGTYAIYTDAKEFAGKVTGDLIAITRDKHLNFRVIEPTAVGEAPVSPLHHPVRYYLLRNKENTGFYELKWIEPNIGYLDLRRFNHFGEAKSMILAAMTFLAAANAIIIDVRENGGGSGDYLSSYFLPYPTQLSGSYSRADDSLTEFWTRKDIGMEPRTDVPLFILTGPRTFSAAESFAYDLQSRKRATLVGEPTKGGAHSVDVFQVDDQFEFYISTERGISPVTGGNWEGAGVIPDVAVSAEAALAKALSLAREAGEAYGRVKEARLKRAVDEMQSNLDQAEKLYRENRSEEAKASMDALFQIAAAAGLISEFLMDVFAYNYRSGENDQMLLAILNKNIEFFPQSAAAFERLGSYYASKGDKELALRYFKKALEVNPDDRNIAKMIKELQGR